MKPCREDRGYCRNHGVSRIKAYYEQGPKKIQAPKETKALKKTLSVSSRDHRKDTTSEQLGPKRFQHPKKNLITCIFFYISPCIQTKFQEFKLNFNKNKVINPIQDGSSQGCSRMGSQKITPSLKPVSNILQ